MSRRYTQRGGDLEGVKEFLNSNSIVAKVAFILLILIVFVILIRIGTNIISYIFSPSPNPFLFNGMIDAKQGMIIAQNPSDSGSIPIMRSVDETRGIEFTWSIWVYIKDLGVNSRGLYGYILMILTTNAMNINTYSIKVIIILILMKLLIVLLV